MKTKNLIKKILFSFVFCLFFNNSVYSQYTGNLPLLATPLEDNYTHDQTTKGHYFIMNYGGATPEVKSSYSFMFGGYNETLRVCQNGTLALLGSGLTYNKYPTLNFYTWYKEYRGSINTEGDNLNLIAKNRIKFRVNTTNDILSLNSNMVSIHENLELQKEDITLRFGLDDQKAYGWIGTTSSNGLILGANNHANMYLDDNYRVYIGTSASHVKQELKDKFSLFVNKGVLSEDFAISPKNTWADYVFDDNYNLQQLSDVERFIKLSKHLPGVPSSNDIKREGYSQHEMNKILLQKIEELTLHLIEQNQKIKDLESQLNK